MEKEIVDNIIIVTPRGVAHILTVSEYLTFVRVRSMKGGFSISKVDNISRSIKIDGDVIKKIEQIENSVAKENL